MRDKIKIIFIPTILALLGLLFGYTVLHWLLFIHFDLFHLKQVVTNFAIPCVLAVIASWIYLRPRLKMLNLEAKRGNWRDFYCFILMVVFFLPLIIAQEYLVTASGKLTAVSIISEIDEVPATKYYTIEDFFINKPAMAFETAFDASGKYNEHFNMHIYIAVPILKSSQDTSGVNLTHWLGVEYKETISNRLDQNEKESKYRDFASRSEADFNTRKLGEFVYLERAENSDAKDGFLAAINKSGRNEQHTILLPVNEPFEERNGNKLAWIAGALLAGPLVWLLMILIPKVDGDALERLKDGRADREALQDIDEVVSLIKPREGYFVTPILMWLNVGLFIAMIVSGLGFISFAPVDLMNWGANYGPVTRNNEWWRLLSSMFLHGGVMHVIANMYALMFVGIFLEPFLGKAKFLGVYLLAGLAGSIASIWWYEATVSVGASGAIFGLYGFLLAAILTKTLPAGLGKALMISTVFFVGFNLLMGLTGGIDNAAHIGGLLIGFVCGLAMCPAIKRTLEIRNEEANETVEPSQLN